ncbi:MAG: BspA family leucine-rich repeat surface protein, partial [Oscillospiraceae bacterium]|nr:BspA family leucine-rich repeat surface protein [Oscillospiraceae bacterium]
MGRRAVRKKENKNKVAVLLLFISMFIILGASFAFFSDFVAGLLTGRTGTLDINATVTGRQHFTRSTGEYYYPIIDGQILNLNPGDIIEINFDVWNEGNKSAWLRDRVNFIIGTNHADEQPTTGGMFELYSLDATIDQIRNNDAEDYLLTIATNTGFVFESPHLIINGGTGIDGVREVETGENVACGPITRGYFLFFRPEAGNEYQQINLSFEIRTEAMQFRNNPNPIWENVVDREFTIGELGRYVVSYGIVTANNSNLPWRLYNDGILEMIGGNIQWTTANSPWINYNDYIKEIIFHEPVMGGTSIRGLFANLNNVTSIEGLDNLNTENVINMSEMFVNTSNLKSLDLSTWNTSNVTNMGGMFFYATSLTNLNVSTWDTSNVTNINNMFRNVSLTSLDVSNWDTGNVVDMRLLFAGASSLTSLDVSNWNTSSVTNMSSVFNGTSSLTSIDLSNWNTGNVTTMGSMFSDANSLSNIGDVSNWDVSNVTIMNRMFLRTAFTNLDLSGWDTSNTINMEEMFTGVNTINSIKLGENFII